MTILTGENHPNWKGGQYLDSKGYRFVLVGNGKYRREHRVVAEKILGRPLEKGESVHHKDGDKLNNHPDNLLVLSTSEHIQKHWKESDNPFCQPRKKIKECIVCHEIQTIYAKGKCHRCYMRQYMREYE